MDHATEGDKPIDVEKLEQVFEAAETKKKEVKKKEVVKSLLDMKRSQNLGIFLSNFKTKVYELEEKLCLLPPSEECIPIEQIQALKKLGPTPEEKEAYERYKGDKSQLSNMDQFLMALIEIPNFVQRLNLQIWIHELPLQFDELQPNVETALAATTEMLESKRFEEVLLYGLSIGNHVNGGTAKGAKHGVQLKSFPKMADSKGADKKTTLMDFLYTTLRKRRKTGDVKTGDLTKFTDDLKSSVQMTDTSVKALQAEVQMLAKDIVRIEDNGKRLQKTLGTETPQLRSFFEGIEKFVTVFMENLVELDNKAQETTKNYAQVLAKFGEKKNADSEEVFGHIKSFADSFAEAYKKYKDDKEKEKKEKKKRKKDKEMQARKDRAKGVGNPFDGAAKPRRSSVFDNDDNDDGDGSPDDVNDEAQPVKEKKKRSSSANPFAKSTSPEPPADGVGGADGTDLSTSGGKKKSNPFAARTSKDAAVPEVVEEEPEAAGAAAPPAAAQPPPRPAAPKSPKPARPPPPKSPTPTKKSNPFNKQGSGGDAAAAAPAKRTFDGPPSRQGYLEKQGKEKWSKRWVELDATGYFNYFKKKDGKNLGTVFLQGCAVTTTEDLLVIQSENRTYTFRAGSAVEAVQWAEEISYYTEVEV